MKKALKITFRLIAVLLVLVLLAAIVTGGLIMHRAQGSEGDFTCLIVLGTKVEGTEPSPMLNDRIKAAADYLQKHPDVIAIVTGGKADGINISEAQCMYNGLTELGIDPDRILMEPRATTTAENFQYSVALLEEKLGSCPRNIGVLSSEFHLLRSGMLAKRHGITAITIPAKTSDTNTFVTYFLREIFMVWYNSITAAIL